MKTLVSVIIPIYNTGNKLQKTLKSIKSQTFKDFECILINDGSEDNKTLLILDKISKEDKRFKVFHKSNEGIEKSRIFGIKRSLSDLIIFCDHDDYYELNAFQILYNAYANSNADIVSANCYSQRFYKFNLFRKIINPSICKEIVTEKDEFIKHYFINFFGINKFPVSTWGKLYKKELFDQELQFLNVNFIEDIIINTQIFDQAKKIHFVPDKIYTHIYGGLSSNFNFVSVIKGYDKIFTFRKVYLDKYQLDYYPIYIEYKNVIYQNIDSLIEYKVNKDIFFDYINILKKQKLYNQMCANISSEKKGDYIKLIEKNEFESLYLLAKSKLSLKRRIKFYIRNFIKKN